ncbi:hypothetical protein BKG63_10985 [Mycobacteroides chelonae]|nr:hypothetical protein BKG63_10985 [Mycobacteroides chelonae]
MTDETLQLLDDPESNEALEKLPITKALVKGVLDRLGEAGKKGVDFESQFVVLPQVAQAFLALEAQLAHANATITLLELRIRELER